MSDRVLIAFMEELAARLEAKAFRIRLSSDPGDAAVRQALQAVAEIIHGILHGVPEPRELTSAS